MYLWIAVGVALVIAIVALVVAVKALARAEALRHTLNIFGKVIKDLPGAQPIIERELAEAEACLKIIDNARKKLDRTFRSIPKGK